MHNQRWWWVGLHRHPRGHTAKLTIPQMCCDPVCSARILSYAKAMTYHNSFSLVGAVDILFIIFHGNETNYFSMVGIGLGEIETLKLIPFITQQMLFIFTNIFGLLLNLIAIDNRQRDDS